MATDEHQFLFREETHRIIGCAFEILNTLGHGLLEKPYENALCVELGLCGIPWVQQPRYDVVYKTVKVGEYIPDLIVFGFVVVDTKVIEGSPITISDRCSIT